MLRRLFTLLSAASLVLCVATCALWVRGHSRIDRLAWTSTDGTRSVRAECSAGHFFGCWERHPSPRPGDVGWRLGTEPGAADYTVPLGLAGTQVRTGPFAWGRDRAAALDRRMVVGPAWAAAIAFLALPAGWAVWSGRAGDPARPGRCPGCGCDLRLAPGAGGSRRWFIRYRRYHYWRTGRCPACGAVPSDPARLV